MHKLTSFILAGLLALCIALPVQAEEEFAPGYNACWEKVTRAQDNAGCWGEAATYWDGVLNKNYKKALAFCDDTNQGENCKNAVRQAQLNWIKYKEAMMRAIPYIEGPAGVHMHDAAVAEFLARETKKQAKALVERNFDPE